MTVTLPVGFALHRAWDAVADRMMPGATPDDVVRVVADAVTWEQPVIRVYDKEHLTPRMTCWYGETSYTYSGRTNAPHPMPQWLDNLRRQAEAVAGARFNSALLNYYRDGSDSVSWHADDEDELGEQPTIASLSIGASRRFSIKERRLGGARWDTVLEHGDLLVMSGRSQLDYLHSVPKTARPAGPRINLTFRWIHS